MPTFISNFDQIEEARFGFGDFKSQLNDLLEYIENLVGSIGEKGLLPCFDSTFTPSSYEQKASVVREGMDKLEQIIEAFAGGLSLQLNETYSQHIQFEREKDEFSKSLQQIELCYEKNKKKLERDLNKMEFKVKQVQDTREKMQLRHIKGLDIVQSEVNRIMPNSLTDKDLKPNFNQIEDEEEEQRTYEQIKRDLEDVEDIFAANLFSAKMGGGSMNNQSAKLGKQMKDQSAINEPDNPPEEEWLSSSSSERNQDMDTSNPELIKSQEQVLKQLEQDKEKIMSSINKEGDPYKQVLV